MKTPTGMILTLSLTHARSRTQSPKWNSTTGVGWATKSTVVQMCGILPEIKILRGSFLLQIGLMGFFIYYRSKWMGKLIGQQTPPPLPPGVTGSVNWPIVPFDSSVFPKNKGDYTDCSFVSIWENWVLINANGCFVFRKSPENSLHWWKSSKVMCSRKKGMVPFRCCHL